MNCWNLKITQVKPGKSSSNFLQYLSSMWIFQGVWKKIWDDSAGGFGSSPNLLFVMLPLRNDCKFNTCWLAHPPKTRGRDPAPNQPTILGRLYAPWLWSLSTRWKNLRCWWRPWRWGEKMPDPWRIPMGRIHGIFTYIFYENRESNQRCEKINNDKHKFKKIICENEKIKNHMSQNKGKQQNIGKNNKK